MNNLKLLSIFIVLIVSVVSIHAQNSHRIDNFAPYVKKVEIISSGETIYEEEWSWNSEIQTLEFSSNCFNGAAQVGYDAIVIIYTSESMEEVSLDIENYVTNGDASMYNTTGTEWYYTINNVTTQAGSEQEILQYNITINGSDKNGNPIQGFNDTQNEIPYAEIKRRISPTEWSDDSPSMPDTRHLFKVGTPPENYSGCMFASFTVQNNLISDDEYAVFINNSQGANEYEWVFTGGTPNQSSEENPKVQYSAAGTYPVTLTAKNSYGQHTITKQAFITVRKTEAFSSELDFSYDPQTNTFSGISAGNVTSWNWEFSSGSPQNDVGQTTQHIFGLLLLNEWAKLTVTYSDGSTKTKAQKIFRCGYPFTN